MQGVWRPTDLNLDLLAEESVADGSAGLEGFQAFDSICKGTLDLR